MRTLLLLALCAAASARNDRPNVVLILVDDLGWSDVACAGTTDYYATPNVDRLAAEGTRFVQGYAACAVCSPSRAAVLTGRHPARVGVTDWIHHSSKEAERALELGEHLEGFDPGRGRPLLTPINRAWLDADEVTLAELLAAQGYVSAYVGKWHLGPVGHLPTDQGFDENHGGFQVGSPPSYFDPYANKRFPGGIHALPPRAEGEYLTDREADECVRFLAANSERPFFLMYAPYAVHSPLRAPEALVEAYAAKPGAGRRLPVYGAMVERVDAAVGRVLDALDEAGVADETIVVFTSDNGGAPHFPPTQNAPLRRGKGFPYEGGLRVPFLVRWPGEVVGGRVVADVPALGTDLLPTLAAACGVAPPTGRSLDGVDLLPLLRGGAAPDERPLVWHFPHYWWGTRLTPYSVLREGRWKLVHQYATGADELYDLAADPGEARDLAAEHPGRARALRARLFSELRRLGAKLPAPNPDADDPGPAPPGSDR